MRSASLLRVAAASDIVTLMVANLDLDEATGDQVVGYDGSEVTDTVLAVLTAAVGAASYQAGAWARPTVRGADEQYLARQRTTRATLADDLCEELIAMEDAADRRAERRGDVKVRADRDARARAGERDADRVRAARGKAAGHDRRRASQQSAART